jgi:hypothetical protein
MPRAFELTWGKSLHRWVKVIRGRKYYFSGQVAEVCPIDGSAVIAFQRDGIRTGVSHSTSRNR